MLLGIVEAPSRKVGNGLFSRTAPNEIARFERWLESRFQEAERLSLGAFLTEVFTVTPAVAEYILERCNTKNRPLSAARSEKYAEAMREGRWLLTSQGISFSRDRDLIDGQHRLNGIVIAGVPVKMLFTFGEDARAFEVLDTGAKRSAGDTLAIDGVPNYVVVAAAARLRYIIDNEMWCRRLPKITNDIVVEVVNARPSLVTSSTAGAAIGGKLKSSTGAATVALSYIVEQTQFPERMVAFEKALLSGEQMSKSVAVLRDGMRNGSLARHAPSISAVVIAASFIKAWNNHLRGSRATVKWNPADEFPKAE